MLKTPLRTDAMAHFPYTLGAEKEFNLVSKYGDEVNLSVRRGDFLLVPRELAPLGEIDARKVYPPFAIKCKKPPKNAEQQHLISKSTALFLQGRNHILQSPTGSGKTYMGCSIAVNLGQPTLIIVSKQDLIPSWKTTLINLIGVKESDIGHIQQSVCDYKGKKFVIAMLHSLIIPDKYSQEMFNYFGMVIFDEVHRLAAITFMRSCQLFPAKYRLGLSATPTRADKKDPVLYAHIGPILVVGTTVPMKAKILVKKTGWNIPKITRYIDGEPKTENMTHAPGRMMGVSKKQASDTARNQLIVDFVTQAYKSGRTIVIMSDLIDGHLVPLFHLLAKNIPAEQIDYYIGGRKKVDLDIAKTKRVVLATYSMTSEGTDVPEWDTLVLATPRANIKQPLGRILRTMEGKKQPICLDLLDNNSIFSAFFSKREKQYFEVGAEIVRV